jgi:mono/diheme cytochrome c family protein
VIHGPVRVAFRQIDTEAFLASVGQPKGSNGFAGQIPEADGLLRRDYSLLAILVVIFSILAFLNASARGDELARGRYLVEALMACDNCHTPRGPDGYEMSLRFSGGSQVFSEKDYTVRGSNISPDQRAGIGAWSDTQIRAAIIDGVGPTGRLAPVMPSESYRVLTPQDLEAIIDFLRAAAPVSANLPPQQKRGTLEPRPAIPGAEAPFTDADLSDRLKRGLYLASLARCMSCHTGKSGSAPDPHGRLGAGGKRFRTPAGVAVASNITSHPTKGIGAWTDEELKRAIRMGSAGMALRWRRRWLIFQRRIFPN